VSQVQQQLLSLAGPGMFVEIIPLHLLKKYPDDALSDDAVDAFSNPVMLPSPSIETLGEIDRMVRLASNSPQGRESLTKFLLEQDYLKKLTPLVEIAEDLEDLPDLHRLSSIMKQIILLNDTQIIEQVVSDALVIGVVGALECKCIPVVPKEHN
jgi:protein phosphatase 4 regulatory subunit 3